MSQESSSFFKSLSDLNRFDLLLNQSMGVNFFIKDRLGRVVAANTLTVERCGFSHESEVLGKTDHELFARDLADKFVKDDNWVMETGNSLENIMELAPTAEGELDCYLTNKMPVYDREHKIIGVAGASISYNVLIKSMTRYQNIAPSIHWLMEHYSEKADIPLLAELCGIPHRAYSELFKSVMQCSPQTFVVRIRVFHACHDLINTTLPLWEIAEKCGFYDNSIFTRQFVQHKEMLPKIYRERYGRTLE